MDVNRQNEQIGNIQGEDNGKDWNKGLITKICKELQGINMK